MWPLSVGFPCGSAWAGFRGADEMSKWLFAAVPCCLAVPRDVLRLCWRSAVWFQHWLYHEASHFLRYTVPTCLLEQYSILNASACLPWITQRHVCAPVTCSCCGGGLALLCCTVFHVQGAGKLPQSWISVNLPLKLLLVRNTYVSFRERNLASYLHKSSFLSGVFTCWNKCLLPVSINSQIKSHSYICSSLYNPWLSCF